MSLLVKIPVKPFMKVFIRSFYQSDVIALTEKDDDYKFIYTMLQKPPYFAKPNTLEEITLKNNLIENPLDEAKLLEKYNNSIFRYNKLTTVDPRFSAFIHIQVSDYFQKEKRFYISPKNIWRFHTRYHDIFKVEFIAFMDKYHIVDNKTLKEVICNFMAIYGWCEDDIKFDTLHKIYYRNKGKLFIKKVINFPKDDTLILHLS